MCTSLHTPLNLSRTPEIWRLKVIQPVPSRNHQGHQRSRVSLTESHQLLNPPREATHTCTKLFGCFLLLRLRKVFEIL